MRIRSGVSATDIILKICYQFQMMGVRDMQRYIILKSIKNAKNDKDLDKYLQRAKVRREYFL